MKNHTHINGAYNVEITTHWSHIDSNGSISASGPEHFENAIIFYEISRLEIELGHTSRIQDDLKADKGNPFVRHGMGNIIFAVNGYDSDPRELSQIPEFQRFVGKLQKAYPCWLYFARIESYWLQVVLSSLSGGGDAVTAQQLESFFMEQIDLLATLSVLAGKSQEEMIQHLNKARKSFGLAHKEE